MNSILRRRRAMMGAQRSGSLPSEYRQVEWIGATSAGPYIQTNVKLTNGPVRLYLKYSCSSGGTYGRDFFGVRNGTNAGQQGVMIKANSSRSSFYVSTGNASGNISAAITAASVPFDPDSVVELDAALSAGNSNGGTITAAFTVDGVSGTAGNSGATGDNTQKELSILGSAASRESRVVGKIFGAAKAWNDGRLVLCAVPCYRTADGAIGMFDTVHDVFYRNAGSGRFTKGADV